MLWGEKLLLLLDRKRIITITDKLFLKLKYKVIMRKKIDFSNPQTFNEKLQWLKLYDRNPEYTKMVDKYEAKKYVSDIIGEEYIIPTLGIYDKFDDIDFEKLPNQFVIKCTHDSGGLVIVRDKKNIDIKMIKKIITKSLKRNFYYSYREWPYKHVKPRIIVEKYMHDCNQKDLIDYKFFCFNGYPKFLYVSQGLENHETARMDFLDLNFNKMPFKRNDYDNFKIIPEKPLNFEKMKDFAKKLSKKTTFVRVDFYEVNSKLYFSELTFFPNAGFMRVEPVEWDKKIGKMLDLSVIGRNYK